MNNERKLELIKTMLARIGQNLKDIEIQNMAGLTPWWPTLEA